MKPLVVDGTHDLPMPGFSVRVDDGCEAVIFTVFKGEIPLVTCVCAASDDDMAWKAIESMYLDITDNGALATADFQAPRKPTHTPWLAVIIIHHDLPDWLGDFERCMAWTWLDTLD